MSDVVAVFDLDGTITRGDTYLSFLIHTLRRRPHRATRLIGLLLAAGRFKLGRLSNDELKSIFLTAIVGGSRRDEVARHVDSFLPRCLHRMIKPEALARIEWHRSRGHRLVLASASVDLYVTRLGAHLRFDETISTRTAWQDDRLTGALDGPNLRGEAKLAAVRAIIGDTRPEVFAYSDHHSDLPLLQFADQAVAVDPSPRLLAGAKANGIKIEYW
jgi:phosphatidylglycerophosphatase C